MSFMYENFCGKECEFGNYAMSSETFTIYGWTNSSISTRAKLGNVCTKSLNGIILPYINIMLLLHCPLYTS